MSEYYTALIIKCLAAVTVGTSLLLFVGYLAACAEANKWLTWKEWIK